MEYIYWHVHSTMPLGQIAVISIIIAFVFGMLLWYGVKNMPEIIDRTRSRELPEGWFTNLANLITKNSQRKEILPKSSEFYVWKHNDFELEAYFDWQDFYDDIDAFDLPIPMSATITILKKDMLYKREIMIAILDRSNHHMSNGYDYEGEYKERMAKKIELRVREHEVGL